MKRKPICLIVSLLSLVLIGWAWWDWKYINGPVAELIGGFIGLYLAWPLIALGTAIAAVIRKERAWPVARLCLLGTIVYFVLIIKALMGLPILGHP